VTPWTGDFYIEMAQSLERAAFDYIILEITEGLVPALQRQGLARTDYTYEQFRDNLLEF
jgi:hypothetical protein